MESIEKISKNERKSFFNFKDYAAKFEEGLDSNQKEAWEKVFKLANIIKENGGRALLVGGSVRDIFMNKISKDYDIEVYGLESEVISEIANKVGKVSDVGKAFGILKLNINGIDIDISLPRLDSKVAEGHKGFNIETNPNMSIEEAAKRRDFTFNSLAADPLTGEIFDYFNGIEDIKNKTLRITDSERFKDDPLRVMRGLQFISRFGLKINPETQKIMEEMVPSLKELPKERMLEEWKKLLVKGDNPTLALEIGMEIGVFDKLYPYFSVLMKTKQEKEWHPEGDVWTHTLLVVSEAKKLAKENNLNNDDTFALMLSALCHDLGKPETTEVIKGRITSRGHDNAGQDPTRDFLESLGVDNDTYYKVLPQVVNHMSPSLLFLSNLKGDKISDGAIRKLSQRIYPATIYELVLVAKADHLGRGTINDDGSFTPLATEYPAGDWLTERAAKLKVLDEKAGKMISGKDLMVVGFKKPTGKEGEKFGKLIKLGDKLRDLSELLKIEDFDEEHIGKEEYLKIIGEIKDLNIAIEKAKSKGIEIATEIRKIRNKKRKI